MLNLGTGKNVNNLINCTKIIAPKTEFVVHLMLICDHYVFS